MTAQAQSEMTTPRRTECPACGKKGKRVSTVTLAHLLKPECAGRFSQHGSVCDRPSNSGCQPVTTTTGWRFCDSPECDVVYFSEEDDTTFTKPQLKVPVGIKERSGERPLCYCFGHSVASIKEELRTKGHSEALEEIRAKMKDPGCRCEMVNPSGSCCLGSVAKGIRIAQEELEMQRSPLDMPPFPAPHTSSTEVETRVLSSTQPHGIEQTSVSAPTSGGPCREKRVSWVTLGAVLTAIMGSACCWLPLLLIAFGFSAAGVAGFFEHYRPYFLATSFVLLGGAWYFTYRASIRRVRERLRGQPGALLDGQTCCTTESTTASVRPGTATDPERQPAPAHASCDFQPEAVRDDCCGHGVRTAAGEPARRGFTMRHFNQVMLWTATAIVVLFALFPHWMGFILGGAGSSGTDVANSPDQQQVVLEIKGMTCAACASIVEKSLRSVPGVTAASVSYEKSRAVVLVPKGQEVPHDALFQAVHHAGYEARLK
ncbi:MAG: hypothetical protein KatS3mg110_2888 [Pirellulaceae bacterium]|nr:MAG: hypothetical protein KatS3mg110_2888 [Pirellulaceae bacterium]